MNFLWGNPENSSNRLVGNLFVDRFLSVIEVTNSLWRMGEIFSLQLAEWFIMFGTSKLISWIDSKILLLYTTL